MQAITERAAAVVGNLSSTKQFYSAIRECGGLQRLVVLLDSGPQSIVTEIAAKALANMAANDSSRKGIRLAGGLPPLINLLTQRPSDQVNALASLLALSQITRKSSSQEGLAAGPACHRRGPAAFASHQ